MRTRQLFLLAAFALGGLHVHAQQDKDDDDREGFNGLRAGWHSSDLDGELPVDGPRMGFYGGYYRNVIKIPLYRLSTGLEYHTAGASSESGDTRTEVRLAYLSIPINNRFKIGPVYGDIGLDPALRLSEKVLVNDAEVNIPGGPKANSVDLLVHVGAGFKFLFLGVEVRYRRGLVDVYDGTRNTGLEAGLSAFF